MKRVIQQYSLSKNSYFQQVSVAGGTSVNQIVVANREITKNGYVYIYVSNESKDFKVYFAVSRKTKCFGNNLKVTHTRGTLLSEEGYYPFGMTMSAISSSAGTVAKNNYKFNAGTELTESFDINYYETYFRQYDAQLGRFTGVDALAEQTLSWSPYQFGYNNPAMFNDPTGLFADYSGYQWLPETFKTSRRNSYLNNGYIDIITGNEESADAQFFLEEIYYYTIGGGGGFNSNFGYAQFHNGKKGFWQHFTEKSNWKIGELTEVVVGRRFVSYSTRENERLQNGQFIVDVTGYVFGASEQMIASQEWWLGNNGKYNKRSWGGNRFTGSRSVALKAAKAFKWGGFTATGATVVIDFLEISDLYEEEGGFGYNTQVATASAAGGILGAWAGAEAGATVGAAIGVWFGGIGAVPGSVIGGAVGVVIGTIWGEKAGSSLGEKSVNLFYGK